MIVCPQCFGAGKTKFVEENLNAPNGVAFTDVTSGANESSCNFCQGNGWTACAGS
jgi:hypothetical protein